MKHLAVVFVLLVGAAGCASEPGPGPDDGSCAALATSISDCGGEVPANFETKCSEDQDGADKLAAAFCSGDTDDGSFGWVTEGGRCFNFNFECEQGSTCRPLDIHDVDEACLPPSASGYCDDDNDCTDGTLCLGEGTVTAGRCQRPSAG